MRKLCEMKNKINFLVEKLFSENEELYEDVKQRTVQQQRHRTERDERRQNEATNGKEQRRLDAGKCSSTLQENCQLPTN